MEPGLTTVADPGARNSTLNPAQLSARLGNLFPVGVVAAELLSPAPHTVLTEAELASVSHCAAKRIDDFTRGRACAHRGLAELGIHNFSLLSGEKREPVWPQGIVGSITHTAGFAAAVVARGQGSIASLGIDCETIESVSPELWERICTPAEQARLAQLPEAQARRQAALIFAAKEAFYKCQFPVSREWVGFEDVEIEAATGRFRVVPQVRLPVTHEWVASVEGRYEYREPWVVTGVAALI
jgi:4'-phosphopantetheinyl transferase EntD